MTLGTEDDGKFHVSISGAPGTTLSDADIAFMKAMEEVGNFYLEYGRVQYGDQWFKEMMPQLSAVFGLHKFSARLYKVLFTREVSVPTGEKLKSDVKDAAIYALFLLATFGSIDWSFYAPKRS
jgi:hypothetical protein